MKKLSFAFAILALVALAGAAQAQAPVNIVYPINGGIYPITRPAPGPPASAYFTSSFSVTCSGGAPNVQGGFDAGPAGGASAFSDPTPPPFRPNAAGGKQTPRA